MTLSGSEGAPRVLIVGDDGEAGAVLHLHLLRAGWSPVCIPDPGLVESIAPIVTPHAIVLVLPETPATSWGAALTASASAAQSGVRVVLIAPSRDIVEPLASVSGAERALARSEVLADPESVLGTAPPRGAPTPFPPPRTPTPAAVALPPSSGEPTRTPPLPARIEAPAAPSGDGPSAIDLMDLIEAELVDVPDAAAAPARLAADVSLVSEHNFFVGPTRRLDSGGIFVSTPLPPAVGTTLEVRLGLPDARKIDVRGEVLFVRERTAMAGRQPAGCGVKLHGVPSWALEVIERFFGARPPILYQP